MERGKPIGVFDSGVGGLSVLRRIRADLPHEAFVYVADSGHAPYGNKADEFITRRAFIITKFLLDQGAKAVVVACNTATAAAITRLRERFDIPIIGVEPALKPAVAATRSGWSEFWPRATRYAAINLLHYSINTATRRG
jgi:glutamate racemase